MENLCNQIIITRLPAFSCLFKMVCCLGLVVIINHKANAQQVEDYAVHANIIYHFTKYINWPDDKKNGDFIIGIVGDTPLYNKLQSFIANKTVGNQKIIIKKFSASAASFYCHILFISEDASSQFKKIESKIPGVATLVVTESDGLARKGACINFVIVHERLKLEINKKIIEQRHLGIATELLNLGVTVN